MHDIVNDECRHAMSLMDGDECATYQRFAKRKLKEEHKDE